MICLNCYGTDFEKWEYPLEIDTGGKVFNLTYTLHRCKKCGDKLMDDEQMEKALKSLKKKQANDRLD